MKVTQDTGKDLSYKQAQLCWDAMQCLCQIFRSRSIPGDEESELRFQLKLCELVGEFLDLPQLEMDEYGRITINLKPEKVSANPPVLTPKLKKKR